MTDGIADTSLFIAHETGRPLRIEALPDRLAVSVITIGELWAGVLAATDVAVRDRRLGTLTAALALDPIPVDDRVAAAWALLRVELRDRGLALPVVPALHGITRQAQRVAATSSSARRWGCSRNAP